MTDKRKGEGDHGKLLYCSFCGKSQHEVRKLIAGPSVFICDECILLCADIVRDGMAAALETMRPGRPVGNAHRAFTQVITAHGMSKESRIGYSIGIGYPPDWGERSVSVRSDDETVLAPGMAFHVILGMWEQDWGYELSEPLLVSDGAPELLTHQPQELVAIT